jgi:hypothetical protein
MDHPRVDLAGANRGDALLAMMQEIGRVAVETKNLQIFVAAARGELVKSAFEASNIFGPNEDGTIF